MANLVRAAALLCLPSVAAAYSTMPACAGSSVRRCLATRSSPIRCADLGDEPQPLVLIATDAEVAEWDSEYEALDEWLEREEEARMMLVRLGSKTTSAEEKATIVDTLLAADASERDALLDVAISLIDRSERQRLALCRQYPCGAECILSARALRSRRRNTGCHTCRLCYLQQWF